MGRATERQTLKYQSLYRTCVGACGSDTRHPPLASQLLLSAMCGSAPALAQLCPRTQYTAAGSVTTVSTTCAPIDLPPLSVRLFALLICSHQGERKRGSHRHSLLTCITFGGLLVFCRLTARFSAALPHPVVWILIFSIVFSEGYEDDQASGLASLSLLMPLAGWMDGHLLLFVVWGSFRAWSTPRSRQFKTDHPERAMIGPGRPHSRSVGCRRLLVPTQP